MLFHLFSRTITGPELDAARTGLELDVPQESNPLEEAGADASPVDRQKLDVLLRMFARSSFRVRLYYRNQGASFPMLTVVVFGEHLLTAAYLRDGIRFC